MQKRDFAERAAHYIFERACPSGGFCFYRLDEPNLWDTYFALAALFLLNTRHHDQQTVGYLQSIQNDDGSYESLARAYYALLSLDILGESPIHDPKAGIAALTLGILASYRRPNASTGLLFHDLQRLVALHKVSGSVLDERLQNELIELVHAHSHQDGGFGTDGSSLEETQLAVAVLQGIGEPATSKAVETFLRSREHPAFGFTGKPGTSLFFLEYIHAGLALCACIGVAPTYGFACTDFVRRCQVSTGGVPGRAREWPLWKTRSMPFIPSKL